MSSTVGILAKQRLQRGIALLVSFALALVLLGSTGCSDNLAGSQSSSYGAQVEDVAQSHLSFRNDDALEDHFEKHGDEMGYATAEDYLAGANAVIANPDALHKLQAEDGDDLYFLESTGEFVVVSPKGVIRTYFLTDRDYFDRQ